MESLCNPVLHSGIENIVKAKDEYYYTSDGRTFIDLESGIWCASLGHGHDKINHIIKKQLDSLSHISKRVLPSYINLIAEKLLKIAEIDGKVMFLNTGSEAIEFSITMAKLIHKTGKLISFTDNYISAYGQATKIDEKIVIKPCLKCSKSNCDINCPAIKDKITEYSVFIFDPFCFSRMILKPPVKLIKTLETEIRKKNGIIIVDEITTGLGRTGKWFGYNHFNLKPDMVVLGKSLGNGYPVSAVIIEKSIIKEVEKTDFSYYQSHQNDPLGCKVAEAVIDVLQAENLVERAHESGEVFLTFLRKDLDNINGVKDIRGVGLLIGIELKKEISVEKVYQRLAEKGIIIGISLKFNMLNINPPYTINSGLIPEISKKIKESIVEVEQSDQLD